MATRLKGVRRRFFFRSLLKYIVLLLVPVICLSLLMSWMTSTQLTSILEKNTERTATLSAVNLEQLFTEMQNLGAFIDASAEAHISLLQVLQEDAPSAKAWSGLEKIASYCRVSLSSKPYIHSLYIGRKESPYLIVNGERVVWEKSLDPDWFSPPLQENATMWIVPRRIKGSNFDKEGTPVISLYQKTRYNEIIITNVLQSYFDHFFETSSPYASVVDSEGRFLMGNISNEIDSNSVLAKMFEDGMVSRRYNGYFFVQGDLRLFPLHYVEIVPLTVLFQPLEIISSVSMIVIIFCLLGSLCLAALFTQREYAKVCRILRVFDEQADIDEEILVKYERGDVYLFIMETVVSVFLGKEKLERELVSHRYELTLAELHALQYQINPHFMFNTLQAIDNAILKEVGHVGEANKMIGLFSQLLRYSLGNAETQVFLEEEIQMSKVYVSLARSRLGNTFRVIWNYDEQEMQDVQIGRFILQPLLENSLSHGRWDDNRPLEIYISFVIRDGYVQASVVDNGPGLDTEHLKSVRAILSQPASFQGEHVGLRNVNSRLVLQYGKEHGLSIHSHVGHGVGIFFRIYPVIDNDTI